MKYIDVSKLVHQLTDLKEGRITNPDSVSIIAGDACTVIQNLMTYHFQTEAQYRLEENMEEEGRTPTVEEVENVTQAFCNASELILNGDMLNDLMAKALRAGSTTPD